MARSIMFVNRVLITLLFAVLLSHAQSTETRPEFEVASIKLNKGCDNRADHDSFSPDRWSAKCGSLRQYIVAAYAFLDGPHFRSPRPEVLGGPRWVDTDMFDISAKAAGPTPFWQMQTLMLQALLEERFRLKVHKEARMTAVYALTVSKDGAGLKRSPGNTCIPVNFDDQSSPAAPSGSVSSPRTTRAPVESSRPRCGAGHFSFDGPDITADWHGMSMSEFGSTGLSGRVGRPVIDKTGLTGLFDIHLEYSRDDALRMTEGPDTSVASPSGTKPSIFKAVQEQLGLKLTSAKAPVEVIIIDHAEPPSEN